MRKKSVIIINQNPSKFEKIFISRCQKADMEAKTINLKTAVELFEVKQIKNRCSPKIITDGIVLRLGNPSRNSDKNLTFLEAESRSLIWSYCFLTDSKVLNKPSEVGLYGLWTSQSTMELSPERAALFSNSLSAAMIHETDWTKSWSSGHSSTVIDAKRRQEQGPFLTKVGHKEFFYINSFIVDDHIWLSKSHHVQTELSDLIKDRSRKICAKLHLQFCQILWIYCKSCKTLQVTFMDPAPQLPDSNAVSGEIITKLLEWFQK